MVESVHGFVAGFYCVADVRYSSFDQAKGVLILAGTPKVFAGLT